MGDGATPRSGVRLPPGEQRTALFSIGAAVALTALKLGTGLISGSLALVSAGVESSGDVVAAALTLAAVRLGSRPADREHPYGHRRAENLAALGEAAILAGGAVVIVIEAIGRLSGGGEPFEPRWYVFAVIAVALTLDASRIAVSLRTAARYESAALRSNAFHFAGDFAGSLAVLVGLVLVRAGFHQGDAVAALVVSAVIFFAVFRLVAENADVLMDRAPAEAHERARAAIDALAPAVELRRLRVRESGGRYFADAVVGVPAGQPVAEAHATADEVEAAVTRALPQSDVVVHVEPRRRGLRLRDRVLAIALSEPLVSEAHDITLYEDGDRTSVSLHLKLPEDTTLAEAHDVAERVEHAIEREPSVEEVHTHLEPMEQPVAVEPAGGERAADVESSIAELVRARTGAAPRTTRLMRTAGGVVVFLTVGVGEAATLADAHRLASEIEEDLRREHPFLADVVVHTEP